MRRGFPVAWAARPVCRFKSTEATEATKGTEEYKDEFI
jgi:hypothetical protein